MKIKIVQINQKIVQAYINKGYVRGTSGVATNSNLKNNKLVLK